MLLPLWPCPACTGEYLLQTQAGSAVGRQLITLAKSRGIRTINVVRRRETFDELKALGADEVRPASCSSSPQSGEEGIGMSASHSPYQKASPSSACKRQEYASI